MRKPNTEYDLESLCELLKLISHHTSETETFPWRKTKDPYHVFLAEMLLVRTRADVVAALFDGILQKYPDIETLALADEKELAELLRPLGLKKRVNLLKRAAQFVAEAYDARFPKTLDLLKKIPGMGEYTARAFRVFAFGIKDIPPDTNIFRLLSRITGIPTDHPTKGSDELVQLVRELSERCNGYSTAAVLDFARTVCRPRNPLCNRCKIKEFCRYFLSNK